MADTQQNPPILTTFEDSYISMTSIPPSFVLNFDHSKLLGVSVEAAILNVLKEIEVCEVKVLLNLLF